jgi:hypothetical protein
MMIVIASVAVSLVAFILYALERRSKKEPIVWEDALKLSVFGGLLSAGVVFAASVESVKDVVGAVDIPSVQDMFVGTPTF